MNRLRPAAYLAAGLIAAPAAAQAAPPATEKDHDAIYKIKDEGFTHSRLDTASWLTDVYGARRRARRTSARHRAVKKLTEWGGQNARLETR